MTATTRLASRLRDWWSLLVALAVAGVARIAYAVFAIGDYAPKSDAFRYYDLARNINNGLGFSMAFPWIEIQPTAFRPPAYPFLLAGTIRVFGESIRVGQVLDVLIGLLVVPSRGSSPDASAVFGQQPSPPSASPSTRR